MLAMVLMTGGGNDLLDFVPAKAFWELKGAAVTVAAMEKQLQPADPGKAVAKALAVRRLMAIRTLGELKKPEALPILRPLLGSQAMFEADYARQAIAAIEGKPFARPRPPADRLAKDLRLLPAGCGLVGQMSLLSPQPVDIGKLLKDMGGAFGREDPEDAVKEVVTTLVTVVEMTGNIRLDTLTLGMAADIGRNRGFFVLIARGKHDSKTVRELLTKQDGTTVEAVDGVEVIHFEDDAPFLILPSDELAVLVAQPPGEETLPAKTIVAALKAGKGGLGGDADIMKLIQSVDTTPRVWVVAKVSDAYRKAGPIVEPFETATLVIRSERDAHNVTLTAQGADAKKVAQAVAELDRSLAKGREEIAKAATQMPALKPFADLVASIKTKTDGAKVTVTATVKGASPLSVLPLWFMGAQAGGPGPSERREGPAPGPDDF